MPRSRPTIELDVFNQFANVAPIPIEKSTIVNRHPPEPDILCQVTGQGEVGFELTELIDASHMERLSLMSNTKSALFEHLKSSLTADERARFESRYGDALLHFVFDPNARLNERRKRLKAAFDKLLKLPEDVSDAVLKYDSDLMPALQQIRIRRSTINGPVMDVDAFGWLGDPTEGAISKKLRKTYGCSYPIELLAYIDWDLLPPEGAWKAAADEAAAKLDDSQFRRIWVYHVGKNEIMYVRPILPCAF